MSNLLYIFLGGALGSLLRYFVITYLGGYLGNDFPYGTLAVNVLGCFLIGFLFFLFNQENFIKEEYRNGIIIGVLGGFTTFSSYGLDVFNLMVKDETLRAGIYIFASNIISISATMLGYNLSKILYKF